MSWFEWLFGFEDAPTRKKRELGYPSTFPLHADTPGSTRPKVFDPALAHFPNAYRLGDPGFSDWEAAKKWRIARHIVIDHLLQQISSSKWKDHLVLRGSLLLKTWLGDAAREPGDIDWVFRPDHVESGSSLARALFKDFASMAAAPLPGGVVIDKSRINIEDIWTYERASGRRIVFSWTADGLPPGEVQMDVVFRERLLTEPALERVGWKAIENPQVWAASKEESLAWKILWLETDMHPQGKDLYDATLLAEQTKLSYDVLHLVLSKADWHRADALSPSIASEWQVDWENFIKEYPWVKGDVTEWKQRLTAALSTTFGSSS